MGSSSCLTSHLLFARSASSCASTAANGMWFHGEPVAQNLGLLCLNHGHLRGIAFSHFGPLGFPGRHSTNDAEFARCKCKGARSKAFSLSKIIQEQGGRGIERARACMGLQYLCPSPALEQSPRSFGAQVLPVKASGTS